MNQESSVQIPILKREALIEIKLGTKIIGDLQGLLSVLVKRNDMKLIEEKSKNKEPLTAEEQGIVALGLLRRSIEILAEEQGMLEYKDLKDMLTAG